MLGAIAFFTVSLPKKTEISVSQEGVSRAEFP
jgi:hypothetical protein